MDGRHFRADENPRLLPGHAGVEPRVNDDANDGAEQGCDQDIARGFVGLMHGGTMPRVEPAIKSQLIQKCPHFAA